MQSAPASFRRRTDQTSRRSGKSAGRGGVVAGLFVGEQEAGGVAVLGSGQAVLGVEEDRRGVAGEDARNERLKDF